MDVGTFCAQSRVLIVAGKGGVGKTTMAAALARLASRTGRSVLIVELEGKSGITGAFGLGHDLGYEEVELQAARPPDQGSVRARRITPDDALVEYLEDHGLRRVSKRLVSSGVVDVVSTAIPGIRDVLVLGKIKQLEREEVADLIVVDAPATGHAITFLTSASGLVNAARGGPLRSQANEVVELEGKSGITGAFGLGQDLGYEEMELQEARPPEQGTVRARRITPDDALVEYLEDHGLRRVSKRLVSSGVVDVVSTAIPGIRDVLVLGKIKQLEREGVADLIVVDAPATGHAITFLTSASGLVNAARGGPLRSQANEVVELLADPSRCRVVLVTLPEDMPVSETIESAFTLEDKAGVQLGPVIVNATDPVPEGLARSAQEVGAGMAVDASLLAALEEARRFRLERHAISAAQIERLARDLPLPQLLIPAVAAETIGIPEIDLLAGALATAISQLPEVPTP